MVSPRRFGDERRGQGIPDLDGRGQRVTDDSFLLCFNAHSEPIEFTLPPTDYAAAWVLVVDTSADPDPEAEPKPLSAGTTMAVDARAVMVLQAASG
jgi:glycogen operon protein